MKKILIVVFLFFLSILKPGIKAQVTQEWLQIYSPTPRSNNNADKSAMDKFGNFIVAGRSEITDTSSTDLIILKYSSSGNLLWESRYNGPANNTETFKDMVLDDSCNIYVTCSSFEGAALGNINWVTLKYSPNGVLLWKQSLDWTLHKEDVPFSITLDNQNNLFVAGYVWAPPLPYQNFDIAIAKYNGITGDLIWTNSYNCYEFYPEWGYSVTADDSGNAYVSGYSKRQSNPSQNVIVTIKYDSSGNQIWIREFLRATAEYAIPMYSEIDNENNTVICGNYNGNTDFVTLKYNPQGDLLWSKYFNGIGNNIDICNAMYIDNGSYIYICGRSVNSGTGTDLLLIKYKPDGDTSFVRYFDSGNNLPDEANAIGLDSVGNVYLTGETTIIGSDFLTVKYSSTGELLWQKTYSLPMTNIAYGIGLDRYDNVYIAGFRDSSFFSAIVCIKYSQLTGVETFINQITNNYSLTNYPNPFNPVTNIKYTVPESGKIKIIVYDVKGKEIEILVNDYKTKGIYESKFFGNRFTSGVYFYSLSINNKIMQTNKMLLIK
ncbi:MAG: T9SS type A sorting domain-containing protein [Ignavibacteria bacterium]